MCWSVTVLSVGETAVRNRRSIRLCPAYLSITISVIYLRNYFNGCVVFYCTDFIIIKSDLPFLDVEMPFVF